MSTNFVWKMLTADGRLITPPEAFQIVDLREVFAGYPTREQAISAMEMALILNPIIRKYELILLERNR